MEASEHTLYTECDRWAEAVWVGEVPGDPGEETLEEWMRKWADKSLGEVLRDLRIQKGEERGFPLYAKEVAATVGVKPSAIYMWEQGNREPKLENIEALARYYGVHQLALILKMLESRGEKPEAAAVQDWIDRLPEELRQDVRQMMGDEDFGLQLRSFQPLDKMTSDQLVRFITPLVEIWRQERNP